MQSNTSTTEVKEVVIRMHSCRDYKCKSAIEELRTHLSLILDNDKVEVLNENQASNKYEFKILHPGKSKIEEVTSVWEIGDRATIFRGNSSEGVLLAVYEFLQSELDVRWIQPGPKGMLLNKQSKLILKKGTYRKKTSLLSRGIRLGVNDVPVMRKGIDGLTLDFNQKNISKYKKEVQAWRRRMQMGGSKMIVYGHAFSNWWQKYGESNPEYFALNKFGKRAPEVELTQASDNILNNAIGKFQNIKMCVSNVNFQNRVISNWRNNAGKTGEYINVCENDGPGAGFCRCGNCIALDQKRGGEKFGEHLTDRYVYFTNEIAKKARISNKEAIAVMYAYNETESPPRKFKVEPNVLVVIVPTSLDPMEIKKTFEGWRKMGATQFALRPNYHHYFMTGAIPLGIEKQLYDVAQLAIREGVQKLDFDCLMHNWSVNGFADYILSRTMADPSKSFSDLEQEYFSNFGAAANHLKDYYKYWRNNVWDPKLKPNLSVLQKKGKYYNFMRGLMWNLQTYYTKEDFELSGKFLARISTNELVGNQGTLVNKIKAAHKHASLLFKGVASSKSEKLTNFKTLYQYRVKEQNNIDIDWFKLLGYEIYWGDVTMLKSASQASNSKGIFLETPLFWMFKLDERNVGLKSKWYQNPVGWDIIRTDNYWQKPHKAKTYLSTSLINKLSNYQGVVWYHTVQKVDAEFFNKNLYLNCPGINGSGSLYVNGKKVKDFKANGSIEFPISKFLDKSQALQKFTFRIDDRSGQSGIFEKISITEK